MLDNPRARGVMSHVIDPVARGLLRIRVSPDAVTLIGTIGVSAAAVVFYPRGVFWWGSVVITLFVFSDLLDGSMARQSGRSGPWGNFWDSTLDRVADATLFGALLIWFVRVEDWWTTAATLVCLVGGGVVSYAKARAESLGLEAKVGIAGRSERLIIALVAAGFYGLGVPYLLPAALDVLAVLTVITVVQRVLAVRRQAPPTTGTPPVAGPA